MKIILLKDVHGLGRRGEVKDAPDGYARNFLFPNKLAEPGMPAALAKLAAQSQAATHDDAVIREHLGSIAKKIKETGLQFELTQGKDGSIFGSVNKEAILKALREHGLVTTERVDVHLDHPLKEFGEHLVTVDFKKGIEVKLKIIITHKKLSK